MASITEQHDIHFTYSSHITTGYKLNAYCQMSLDDLAKQFNNIAHDS